ncbi:MAG: glycosyltransferase family 2 protein [Candidatus Roizmanbacteria bacterium]|nr:glycosyltransferase family 2 protein [Candidatus Roizmanbacteria bacterium]
MDSITAIIHTYNEEDNICECIRSAKLLTNDVILIDMQSTDTTVLKARKCGATVYTTPQTLYVEPARAFGISMAHGNWVCILDADERMTKELAHELKTATNDTYTHYKIPRKNFFVGKKWLKHGGWWPDYQVRFIKKIAFQSWPSHIHSMPIITGNLGVSKNALTHLFHPSLHAMVKKTIIYEDIESQLLYVAKRTVTIRTFFRKFLGELFRRLIRKLGFLDGTLGIIESLYQGYSKTITWLFLFEKRRQ